MRRDNDDDLMPQSWAGHLTPGDATRYIREFCIEDGTVCILCCRVSGRERKANLKDQDRSLRRPIIAAGGVVHSVVCHAGSGWDCEWLVEPARIAKRVGAILIAESTDRFVRNQDYAGDDSTDLRATDAELQELRRCTLGVPLMTWLPPNMSLSDVKSYQTKRGQFGKRDRGGRPGSKPGHKKRRRERMKTTMQFYNWLGASLHETSRRTGVPVANVSRWFQRFGTND